MKLWMVIIIGLLFGVTDFLPISSTGHLSVLKHTLGVSVTPQICAILNICAVILIIYVFHRDMKKIFTECVGMLGRLFKNIGISVKNIGRKEKKEHVKIIKNPYDKYALFLLLAMVPEVILTVLLQPVARVSDSSLLIPGMCLIINGVVLLIADNTNPGYRSIVEINVYSGLLIGLVQGLAFLPGFSYPATAFTMALLFGYQKEFAVRTSFFLMIPAMLTDAVFHIIEIGTPAEFLGQGSWYIATIVMMVIVFIVGNICIRATLLIVRKKKFGILAIENLILGTFAISWYFFYK